MTNLKDFIKTALLEIDAGVREATKEARYSNPKVLTTEFTVRYDDCIDFDVAVTATDEKGKTSGIGVVAASLFSVGAKGESKVTNQEISRIKFRVRLDNNNPNSHFS